MKGHRTSTQKTLAIIKAKLSDPNKSLRDIEKETGIPKSTVWETLQSIPSLSDNNGHMIEKLDDIVGQIIDIQRLSLTWFKDKAMQQKLTTKEVKDLSEIWKVNWERKQILEWKPTDIKKFDFDLGTKSLSELEELRKGLLK